MGIGGWVRNVHDGSVEATLLGPRDRLYAAIDQVRANPSASIHEVTIVEEPCADEPPPAFTIRR